MKFSTDTVSILKNFSTINSSIVINPGNILSSMFPDKSLIAMAEVPEEFDEKIAIYDLPQFLNVWGMFSEPHLEIKDGKQARIVEGNTVARYTFAEPSLIPAAPKGIASAESVTTFKFKADQLQRILKSAAAMALEDIIIRGSNGVVTVSAITHKSPSSNSLDIVVGDTDNEFLVHIKIDHIKLMVRDYKVTITNRYVMFDADCEGLNLKKLTYWIGVEHDSKFN